MHTAKQAARLRHEAMHDALTGLSNRRAFRARLEREIEGRAGFALVLCDMDNLKTVNDTRGHDAGDKALQLLADGAAQPAAAQRRGLPHRRRRVRGGAAAGEPAGRRARDAAAARRRGVEHRARRRRRSRPASASPCSSRATTPSAWSPAPTAGSTRRSAGAPRASPSGVLDRTAGAASAALAAGLRRAALPASSPAGRNGHDLGAQLVARREQPLVEREQRQRWRA